MTAPPAIAVIVADANWRKQRTAIAAVRRAAALALKARRAAGDARNNKRAVAILLASDAKLRELNKTFRGRDKATNVLSFPGNDPATLGDLALGFATVAREARAQRKTMAAHSAHLAIHGILHLLGYDHEDDESAETMEALERRLLSRLGIADPYGAAAITAKAKAA